jgi:transcriptional regulator NrdR family protein
MKKVVIKRKGYGEEYDEKKVYASCYAAALNCNYSERRAEELASKVTKAVTKWVTGQTKKKKPVTSEDIRDKITFYLDDNEVSFMYKHHLDLC